MPYQSTSQMNHTAFQQQLEQFPTSVTAVLQSLAQQQGRLDPEQVQTLQDLLQLSTEQLLKALLPLAGAMSTCPISQFSVGAIVEGYREHGQGPFYLGANLETVGQPLKVSIHAEQAAISNAWHQGETRLRRLMVNEAPCGHCRQFINEINEVEQTDILVGQLHSEQLRHYHITSLLPDAFGPADLQQADRLMSPASQMLISPDAADELINAATDAARQSYAPYSGCNSGVALRLENGTIITGRYAENAAFNPGLTAIEAALVNLRLNSLDQPHGKITDAVLVEKQAAISHAAMASSIVGHLDVQLRHYLV